MTTSLNSEAQKLCMDIGKKITIEQCHTINFKLDKQGNNETFKITKNKKSRNRSSTVIKGQILMKLDGNM